jgi:hypothetical protein
MSCSVRHYQQPQALAAARWASPASSPVCNIDAGDEFNAVVRRSLRSSG